MNIDPDLIRAEAELDKSRLAEGESAPRETAYLYIELVLKLLKLIDVIPILEQALQPFADRAVNEDYWNMSVGDFTAAQEALTVLRTRL